MAIKSIVARQVSRARGRRARAEILSRFTTLGMLKHRITETFLTALNSGNPTVEVALTTEKGESRLRSLHEEVLKYVNRHFRRWCTKRCFNRCTRGR